LSLLWILGLAVKFISAYLESISKHSQVFCDGGRSNWSSSRKLVSVASVKDVLNIVKVTFKVALASNHPYGKKELNAPSMFINDLESDEDTR